MLQLSLDHNSPATDDDDDVYTDEDSWNDWSKYSDDDEEDEDDDSFDSEYE